MMDSMPAASFEDIAQVPQKSVGQVRDAVDRAVDMAAGYAKEVSACASKSAETAISKSEPSDEFETTAAESLAANVVEKADAPGTIGVQAEQGGIQDGPVREDTEDSVEDPELGG